ncbi:MAG TPA: kinase, partial [Cyanobacteria bacterium UBA8543]|nr:kinase [Cyanobacteria bacterium UBA8543]
MLISHFLIGPPGCGKSTLANQLIKLQPTAKIISTDAIRALIFGDESIQGDWSLIEENVLSQMR